MGKIELTQLESERKQQCNISLSSDLQFSTLKNRHVHLSENLESDIDLTNLDSEQKEQCNIKPVQPLEFSELKNKKVIIQNIKQILPDLNKLPLYKENFFDEFQTLEECLFALHNIGALYLHKGSDTPKYTNCIWIKDNFCYYYTGTEWRQLNSTLNPDDWVEEANKDNKQYARKNGQWEEVECNISDDQLDWINSQMREQLLKEFNDKYIITTSVNKPLSYDASLISDIEFTVSVQLKFDGNIVKADTTPEGWSYNDDTKTYTKSSNSVVDATPFKYTCLSGKYKGLSKTKNSDRKALSPIYPAWYGMINHDDGNLFNNALTKLTKITNSYNEIIDIPNNYDSDAYLWIISKGETYAKQLGNNLFSDKIYKNIKITLVNRIQLEGYTIYISNNSCESNSSFDNVELIINI